MKKKFLTMFMAVSITVVMPGCGGGAQAPAAPAAPAVEAPAQEAAAPAAPAEESSEEPAAEESEAPEEAENAGEEESEAAKDAEASAEEESTEAEDAKNDEKADDKKTDAADDKAAADAKAEADAKAAAEAKAAADSAAAAAAASTGNPATAGVGTVTVGGTALVPGMDFGSIAPMLGAPTSYQTAINCDGLGEDKIYTFGGTKIYTQPNGVTDILFLIELSGGARTSGGLGCGNSVAEVKAACGEPSSDTGSCLKYKVKNTTVDFYYAGGSVTSVELY